MTIVPEEKALLYLSIFIFRKTNKSPAPYTIMGQGGVTTHKDYRKRDDIKLLTHSRKTNQDIQSKTKQRFLILNWVLPTRTSIAFANIFSIGSPILTTRTAILW